MTIVGGKDWNGGARKGKETTDEIKKRMRRTSCACGLGNIVTSNTGWRSVRHNGNALEEVGDLDVESTVSQVNAQSVRLF